MAATFEDKLLLCLECGAEFHFTVQEQERFVGRGDQEEPKRCNACRDRPRNPIAARPPRPQSPRRPGGAHKRPLVLHPAVCSACGAKTEVPFKPEEGRSVYCRDCHQQLRRRG